jgi:hypothetical protein
VVWVDFTPNRKRLTDSISTLKVKHIVSQQGVFMAKAKRVPIAFQDSTLEALNRLSVSIRARP